MPLFLIPLILGFFFNSASTFTTFYSHHLGVRGGRVASIILRDAVGIPVWSIGYGMAVLSTSTQLFNPFVISSTLAWLLVLAGAMIIFIGLISIHWRAVAPSVNDTLVAHGIYAHVRHPLYSGMILELTGLFLWIPKLSVLVACLIGLVWTMVQARLEELDLIERLPNYKEYMQRVPRFLPKLRQSN
jgi:protein-S-isoprenylcysteine O-methyltransferase Ste14